MVNRPEDQGVDFGTWGDYVSQFVYEDSLNKFLPQLKIKGTVADYGGANGLLKKHLPHVTTIDVDETKQPDVVGDILTHTGYYDVGFCRYVMHYLTDREVIAFVNHAKRHVSRLLIVQFTNRNLRAKYANSQNETGKHFRTAGQLSALFPQTAKEVYCEEYFVGPEFYVNRLGLEDAVPHYETLRVYEV